MQLVPVAAATSIAPSGAEIDGSTTVEYIIDTRHGHIYAEAVHPTSAGEIVESPTVLTYSPYSVLGRNGDAGTLVPQGYTRMYADVVGTGNSGGCYDYGGKREKQTGYDIVEWIAKQEWSTKKIAMEGGSYDGTTAIAAATQAPPHLTTIIPQVAISRWYEYAYSGGIRYLYTNEFAGNRGPGGVAEEGFDTPAAFDFGFAVPPPLDVTNDEWVERVESSTRPCDELEHTSHGYDFDTPDYDAFWLERDYIRHAKKMDLPVLIGGNWGDWNVKQEGGYNLYRALVNTGNQDTHLYFGSRWRGHQSPGGDFDRVMAEWLDHYLKGADNGTSTLPPVTTQTADSSGGGEFLSGPAPNASPVNLFPQHSSSAYPWTLLPSRPSAGAAAPQAQFASLGTNTESGANKQRQANLTWFSFESPILARDARVYGNIEVKLFSSVLRRWVTVTPTVVDIGPEGTAPFVSVTRGFLDSRYRKGLGTTQDLEPGEPFAMTVVEKPTDYTFREGHRIGLQVQTELLEWIVPKPYPGCEEVASECALFRVHWERGKSKLVLPIVNAPDDPGELFEPGP